MINFDDYANESKTQYKVVIYSRWLIHNINNRRQWIRKIKCIIKSKDKDPKFKVGDHVRTSKYKNIFAKGYTPNWPEVVFVIKKV